MNADSEILIGLSDEELEALADGLLGPGAQTLLNDLLDRNKNGLLSQVEQKELDALLRKVDQLTVLKTRARYTLNQSTTRAG